MTGKANLDADELSHNAVSGADDIVILWPVLAPTEAGVPPAKEGEETYSGRQLADQNIADIIRLRDPP